MEGSNSYGKAWWVLAFHTFLKRYCYRPQTSLCFYTCLSVILFSACWHTPPLEQTPPGANTPQKQNSPGAYTPRADTPPSTVHAGRYGQQVGGTHPTGMHTCSRCNDSDFDHINYPMGIGITAKIITFSRIHFQNVLFSSIPFIYSKKNLQFSFEF